MLGAGENAIRISGFRALETKHLGAGDRRSKIGILAGAFDHASPASVARNVEHGRERPGDARSASLSGGHGLRRFHQFGIPG